jgi:hypothetical protein
MSEISRRAAVAGVAGAMVTAAGAAEAKGADDTYSSDELVPAIAGFFGVTAAAAGKAVEKIFSDNGRPIGYIRGDEAPAQSASVCATVRAR